jgi:hypothetical protein
MTRHDTHILLVSAQAAPNLLPALDPELKPRQAVLLVTKKMVGRAGHLAQVLQEAGVRPEIVELDNEHDYGALEKALLDVAAKLESGSFALNVTGGTKLMALAAQAVSQAAGWAVFYVDVDTDEVVGIQPDKQHHRLAEHLRLKHYLQAYGFAIQEPEHFHEIDDARRRLVDTLLEQLGSLEDALGQLNWLAQEARGRPKLQVKLTPQQHDSRNLEALLRHFKGAGALIVEGDSLRFSSEQDLEFVNGGWLEAHVYSVVSRLGSGTGIRDMAINLEVRDETGVKNELDVAFMARNRLFVIECKTARMDKPEAPKANDSLFKLAEVCRRVGGLGTRGMLASYRALRPEEKRLAQAVGLETVQGHELRRLEQRLRTWIGRVGG